MSVLAIGLMYAFNDLYDAPGDRNNPRKDRDMIATYIEHRRTCGIAILVLSLLTVLLASLTLGVAAGAAVGGVMLVNLVYSVVLKGVPVLDVAWCGLWGTLYAAIVGPPLSLAVLVGVITSVCHLYQTLDDRAVDAANGITTTAVRSLALSRNVLAALCVLLFVALRPALGAAWALSAFTPLLFFFAVGSPLTGWLLTKAYFAVVWLAVLGTHAPD
jgi:4-hydroxybenzoate polyprenyltransferase